jgi:prepilin-type processing-associated H-X9-DG protein
MSRWNASIDAGRNRDDGWWVCSMRFRHMKNTTTPVAFFDGHVEARRVGEVKVQDICINK